jgi:hypothetical protein
MNNGLAIDGSFPIANPLQIHGQSIADQLLKFMLILLQICSTMY